MKKILQKRGNTLGSSYRIWLEKWRTLIRTDCTSSCTIPASAMDSFNFDALDSAALDETLSFLNDYDPSTLPDASFTGFENFGQPMMGWPLDQANIWPPLGDADLSNGGMDALTDTSTLGFQVPGHNHNLGNQAAGESFDELR